MSISTDIESAERKYKRILEEFFIETWGSSGLISHGIDHHRRVWHYAGELLNELNEGPAGYSLISPEKLIICCYLHDLGMSADRGKKHGKLSSILCRQFLERNGLPAGDFADVIKAIEDHDDKEYRDSGDVIDLARLLTIADDLDAFGYIGIYRYLEIYLIRGVSIDRISKTVRDNAGKRFKNFCFAFKSSPAIVEKHRIRFEILDDFYDNLSVVKAEKAAQTKELPDNLRIARFISEIVKRDISPENIFQYNLIPPDDKLLNGFFNSLINEASEFWK